MLWFKITSFGRIASSAAITLLWFCCATGLKAQSGSLGCLPHPEKEGCKTPPQPPVAPITCHNANFTSLAGNSIRGDQNWYYQLTNANGHKLFNNGVPQFFLGWTLPIDVWQVQGRHVLLEVSSAPPKMYADLFPYDHARLRIDLGPDMLFEDGSRSITQDVPKDHPLQVYLNVVPGADCKAAQEASAQFNKKPVSPPPSPTAPSNAPGPVAAILWVNKNDQDITNKNQTIIAGVATTVKAGCTPATDGSTASFKGWSISKNLTGGFQGSNDTGKLGEIDAKQSTITVYGAFGGTHPKLAMICVDAKGRSGQAVTTFDVTAPVLKQDGVNLKPGQSPAIFIEYDVAKMTITRRDVEKNGVFIGYGPVLAPARWLIDVTNIQIPRGISFNAICVRCDLEWVQLLPKFSGVRKLLNGTSIPCDGTPGADGTYPYGGKSSPHFEDSPGISLASGLYLEQSVEFSAITYLMWRANANATYVPIAVINWGFTGAAVQDSDPSLMDPIPHITHRDYQGVALGWRIVPNSASVHVGSAKAANGVDDFPMWSSMRTLPNCP